MSESYKIVVHVLCHQAQRFLEELVNNLLLFEQKKGAMIELERLPILWVVRLDFKEPQREAEWNEWYNTVHASRGLPGALRMSRYECIRGRKANPKYMSIGDGETY